MSIIQSTAAPSALTRIQDKNLWTPMEMKCTYSRIKFAKQFHQIDAYMLFIFSSFQSKCFCCPQAPLRPPSPASWMSPLPGGFWSSVWGALMGGCLSTTHWHFTLARWGQEQEQEQEQNCVYLGWCSSGQQELPSASLPPAAPPQQRYLATQVPRVVFV